MTTVLVQSSDNADGAIMNASFGDPLKIAFIDHVTQDLPGFLDEIGRRLKPSAKGASAA
jgi:hypothetical protein